MAAEERNAVSVEASPGKTTARSASERRRTPRFCLTATAEVTDPQSMAVILGRCTDIGLGGCYVDTLNPFARGSIVRVRIHHQGQTAEAKARVVFEHTGMGMGLCFTEIEAPHQRTLSEWIRELSCGLVKESAEAPEEERPQEMRPSERGVLRELIHLLVQRKILSEREGEELSRELQS